MLNRFSVSQMGASVLRTVEAVYYSQALMALSATAYLFVNARLIGSHLPYSVYLASFFGTWSIYLWDALPQMSEEDWLSQPRKAQFFATHPGLIEYGAPTAACVASLLLVAEVHKWSTAVLISILGVCSAVYCGKFVVRYRIKDLPVVKSLLIPSAWLAGGLGLPLAFSRFRIGSVEGPIWLLAVVGWLLLFVDTLELDFRDLVGDLRAGVKTLAALIGPMSGTVGVYLSGAIVAVLLPLSLTLKATAIYWASLLCMAISLWLSLLCARRTAGELYARTVIAAWRFTAAAVVLVCG